MLLLLLLKGHALAGEQVSGSAGELATADAVSRQLRLQRLDGGAGDGAAAADDSVVVAGGSIAVAVSIASASPGRAVRVDAQVGLVSHGLVAGSAVGRSVAALLDLLAETGNPLLLIFNAGRQQEELLGGVRVIVDLAGGDLLFTLLVRPSIVKVLLVDFHSAAYE